jgi:preprotein translocase subunit SecG
MVTAMVVLHIFVCFLLIFIVLVQGGKGAELGAAFGAGSSQTLFGGRGAATFLNKMTTVVAVIFMLTSLLLAIISVKGTSVVKQTPRKATIPAGPQEIPLAPGGAPVAPAAPGQEPIAPTPPPSQ